MTRPIRYLLHGRSNDDFVRIAMVLTILGSLAWGHVIGGCSHVLRSVP